MRDCTVYIVHNDSLETGIGIVIAEDVKLRAACCRSLSNNKYVFDFDFVINVLRFTSRLR